MVTPIAGKPTPSTTLTAIASMFVLFNMIQVLSLARPRTTDGAMSIHARTFKLKEWAPATD